LNLELLRKILKEGHILRRINIRQVSDVRGNLPSKPSTAKRHDFMRFKDKVRREIDHVMLQRLLPLGTVMMRLFLEHYEGKTTFARQAGSYPILVGIPYRFPSSMHDPFDVCVTDWGYRSVTGVTYPMDVNKVPMSWLSTLPGVGKKRAARLVRARPFNDEAALMAALDDKDVAKAIIRYFIIRGRKD
jgi:radical SAM superfamily enzyme with C-terminal helix-hairpin-helix motif